MSSHTYAKTNDTSSQTFPPTQPGPSAACTLHILPYPSIDPSGRFVCFVSLFLFLKYPPVSDDHFSSHRTSNSRTSCDSERTLDGPRPHACMHVAASVCRIDLCERAERSQKSSRPNKSSRGVLARHRHPSVSVTQESFHPPPPPCAQCSSTCSE